VITIFVPTVRLIHNFEIVTNNSHIPNDVYKNGNILMSSCRISMEKNVAKDGSNTYHGYNIVHKILWVTKVYTFPFPGYIFGHIHKLWTQCSAG